MVKKRVNVSGGDEAVSLQMDRVCQHELIVLIVLIDYLLTLSYGVLSSINMIPTKTVSLNAHNSNRSSRRAIIT